MRCQNIKLFLREPLASLVGFEFSCVLTHVEAETQKHENNSVKDQERVLKWTASGKSSISEPAVFTRKIEAIFFCLLKRYPKM